MIQLISRAGNFSCATAGEASIAAPAPAPARNSRRSISVLLLLMVALLSQACSMGRRQPHSEALLQRTLIQKMCQRNVLRHQARGVDQDALVFALATSLSARNQFVDFRMQLLTREQVGLDHLLE